jgi:O-antigen/teichoic acid export membrane protein
MTRPEFTRAAVIRGGSLVALGGIASTALAAVLTTILGVELGDEGFGSYAFVIATAGLLASLARFGLGPIVVRDIAHSITDETGSGTREPVAAAVAVVLGASIVIAAVTISPFGQSILESTGDLDASMTAALAVIFVSQAVFTINAESLRGLLRLGPAAFLGLPVQRLVSLVLVAGAVYALSTDLDPELAVWLTAASAAVAVLASGGALWAHVRRLPGALRPQRARVRAMTRDGMPLVLTDIIGLAGARLPVWVLPIFDDLAGAGVFALSTAFVTLIRFGHKTMAQTLSPFVAEAYHQGSRHDLQRRVRVAAAATSIAALLASAGMIVAGTLIVPRLFPEGFEDAVVVAAVLLIGTVATAVAGPCGLVLNVTGNTRWMARASTISILVALAAIFPASAAGGAIGAAAVMAASTIVRVALQLRYARRQTGIFTVADFAALGRSLRSTRS